MGNGANLNSIFILFAYLTESGFINSLDDFLSVPGGLARS